jgi:predicted acylesterase/phospholipase RssA
MRWNDGVMIELANKQGDTKTPRLLECDIVMAGGVTSGIIYPGAVAMIARRYSFRSIGGTSVGAIAAAVTAAAEYGRRTGSNPAAFDEVARIPKSLGDVATDGHSRLFHLFTPEPATKPLLALAKPLFAQNSRLSQIAGIFAASMSRCQVALPVLVVLIAGLIVAAVLARDGRLILAAVALVMTASLVILTWIGFTARVLARHWLPAWRSNGYGICTGLATPDSKQQDAQGAFEGLANWIHARVQAAAGRKFDDSPLTFGDLWAAPTSPMAEASQNTPKAPRTIELSMIASDLSRNRTVQIPFLEAPSPLYIETSVLERYFPSTIVEWMKKNAGQYEGRVEHRADVIRLPLPQNLPIVFGARLSLSFPVLLSALPLVTPDFAKGRNGDGRIPMRRVWFSDGGLTSNFPIHFFDTPIPSRPTFCLNLVDFDAEAPHIETADDDTDEAHAVARSKPIAHSRAASRTAAQRPHEAPAGDPKPGDPVWGFVSMAKGNRFTPAPFTAFDTSPGLGLASFASTLLNTARFWSDNQMLMAPGVRDRIVNIALRDDEGGLNLDMSPSVISDLDWRGRAAGLLIAARFDPEEQVDPETNGPNVCTFANHRWVRYRNFMASFEDVSRRFALARRASDAAATARGETLLDDMISGLAKEKLGYPAPKAAQPYYRKVTDGLEQLALTMAAETRANENATFDRPTFLGSRRIGGAAPRPKMRSRLRPIVDNDPQSESADLPVPQVQA